MSSVHLCVSFKRQYSGWMQTGLIEAISANNLCQQSVRLRNPDSDPSSESSHEQYPRESVFDAGLCSPNVEKRSADQAVQQNTGKWMVLRGRRRIRWSIGLFLAARSRLLPALSSHMVSEALCTQAMCMALIKDIDGVFWTSQCFGRRSKTDSWLPAILHGRN